MRRLEVKSIIVVSSSQTRVQQLEVIFMQIDDQAPAKIFDGFQDRRQTMSSRRERTAQVCRRLDVAEQNDLQQTD